MILVPVEVFYRAWLSPFSLGVQFEVMDDVLTVIVHDEWRIDRK